MPSTNVKRIGIFTGGGDCPGLNAVIRAVTKTAILEYGLEVYGIRDGLLGLIENRIEPLSYAQASHIIDQGGTILGSSNKANPSRFAVGRDAQGKPVFEDVTARVVENVHRNHLDAIVAVGGDGTMTAVSSLLAHGVRVVGVPKTIDNDIEGTDWTFGFDTAVSVAAEALGRIRTTAASHHRVMFVEMMGRNAGWITLHAGAATGADIILIPEVPFSLDVVIEHCVRRREKHSVYTIVAVSEGARPIDGDQVVQQIVEDSPDPVRLGGISQVLCSEIERRTGIECRATILGHVQRGGTPTARDRVLATLFGHHALKLVMAGEWNKMVAIKNMQLIGVPIEQVAGRQRLVRTDDPLVTACRATGAVFGDACKL